MNLRLYAILSVLATGMLPAASAAVSDELAPETVLQEKIDADWTADTSAARLRDQELKRRAAAEQRAEKLRTLPPERVTQWLAGHQSDDELERMAAAPAAPVPLRPDAARRNGSLRLAQLRLPATLTLAVILGALTLLKRSRSRRAPQ